MFSPGIWWIGFKMNLSGSDVQILQIYQGVVPFICLQAVGILLVWAMPFLATWLPSTLF